VLRVPAAHSEPAPAGPVREPGEVAEALARQLGAMASWLGLGGVAPPGAGDLAGPLRAALHAAGSLVPHPPSGPLTGAPVVG
jgi:uncharacterized protein YcaQ